MAVNLEKHKQALVAAWKDVLDEKTETNWWVLPDRRRPTC